MSLNSTSDYAALAKRVSICPAPSDFSSICITSDFQPVLSSLWNRNERHIEMNVAAGSYIYSAIYGDS